MNNMMKGWSGMMMRIWTRMFSWLKLYHYFAENDWLYNPGGSLTKLATTAAHHRSICDVIDFKGIIN